MANRLALRELQIRLAERLQAARTQGVTPSWLAVLAGGKNYLFPMEQASEIFPYLAIQAVPYTQAWFLGVANLRGGLFGVVDLASYITGQNTQVKTEQANKESCFVALNNAFDMNCALFIDQLAGLRNQEAFSGFLEKPTDAPEFFGHQYVDHKGAVWQEINLQVLAQQTDFLTITA